MSWMSDETRSHMDKVMIMAAEEGNLTVVKGMVELGADVNSRACKDRSVLYAAAKGGDPRILRFLLLKGANPYEMMPKLPLHAAARRGHIEAVKILLEAGFDINATDERGATATDKARLNKKQEMVDLLIKSGADPNL